jgi:hypothetical protein
MEERYILCIPRGCGFNDVMCQISEAYQFALQTNRKLIIDTRLSGIADDFSNYMELRDLSTEIELAVSRSRLNQLNEMTCYPSEIEGQLDLIYHKFLAFDSKKNNASIYLNSLSKLRKLLFYFCKPSTEFSSLNRTKFILDYILIRKNVFDFKLQNQINNTASVIIYHQSGGGEQSIDALNIFKLRREISLEIHNRLEFLGEDYDAIHIRNTDYRTDYLTFLMNIKSDIQNRQVLLCTDDSSIFAIANYVLANSTIHIFSKSSFSKSLKSTSMPLHFQWNLSLDNRKENNIKMLTDLVGLAKARRFFYSNLNYWNNEPYSGISGFSLLADNLNKNRIILDNWLNL